MKKSEKKVSEAINPTDSAEVFEKEVKDFYEKLGLTRETTNSSIEFSFFDKADVSYSSCAGV